jgi:hypothetical protein
MPSGAFAKPGARHALAQAALGREGVLPMPDLLLERHLRRS